MPELKVVDMTAEEFRQFDLLYNHPDLDEDKGARQVLGDGRPVIINWGHPCVGLKVDGELVSVNSTYFGRRKSKNAWGRYVNIYLAYTLPWERYKGYASHVVAELEARALDLGYKRVKSLAGTWPGVRLHMHFGHHFYGIGKRGAIVVDSPLEGGMDFPERIPIEVRNATPFPKLMERAELHYALTQPPFNQPAVNEGEIKDVLDKYYQRIRA